MSKRPPGINVQRPPQQTAFRAFAMVFAIASVYHALPLVDAHLPIHGLHWRHGLFVFIEVVFCALFLLRPRWLYIPLTLLTLAGDLVTRHRRTEIVARRETDRLDFVDRGDWEADHALRGAW